MEIHARFNYDTLDHAQENTPHLVVTLRAPTLDWLDKRQPIAVIPCIDLSGSMRGSKLHFAKQSVLQLIEHLAVGDYAGLVTFDDRAKVVVEPAEVTGDFKDQLKAAVEALRIGGGTNLADGLVQAITVLQRCDLPVKYLHRVIMFTDGQPTMGVTQPKAILKLLGENQARASVSAFGYGEGHGIDQAFLTKLATQGQGNYAYVKDPDGALAAFGTELGGLLSTYATDLHIELEAVNGGRIGKVVTNIEYEEDVTGLVDIAIPNILGEEERHFVFQCDLPKHAKAFPRKTTIFNVRCDYTVLSEDGTKVIHKVADKAQVQFVRAKDTQAEPDKAVDAIVALHQTIRAQLEAEEQAQQGNFADAQRYLQDMQVQIAARGHDQIAAAAGQASWCVANMANYADNRGYLTSYANAGTRAFGTSAVDANAAEALTGAGVALNNSAMGTMSASFTTGGGGTGSGS